MSCKFIEKIPRDWGISDDLTQDVVYNLNSVWRQRVGKGSEMIYLSEFKAHKEIAHTDITFLKWLQETYNRHLRFSDIREAEVEITDSFGFETFLETLYSVFVTPKPRLRRPLIKSRFHTELKNYFKQMRLFGDLIREREPVMGTFPWPVDFRYGYRVNGSDMVVAIALADFGQAAFIERVKDIFAVWNDLKQVCGDTVKRLSVVGAIAILEDHKKAISLLERVSDKVYVFETEREQLLQRVKHDLELSLHPGEFLRGQFYDDLGRVTHKIK